MNPNDKTKQSPREMIRAHAYPVLAAIGTISIVSIAWSLLPISEYARNQNICINQETEKSKAPISWGVRKCNGRSKVYQVK